MKNLWKALTPALALILGGCPNVVQPTQTTLELANDGKFSVQVVIYVSSTPDVTRELLIETGQKIERTIAPGQTIQIVRDCDDLQAIVVDNAALLVIDGFGPTSQTDVLRSGVDFECGNTIRFRFNHPTLANRLDIAISVM